MSDRATPLPDPPADASSAAPELVPDHQNCIVEPALAEKSRVNDGYATADRPGGPVNIVDMTTPIPKGSNMTSTTDHGHPRALRPKAKSTGSKVLRTQKQHRSTNPKPETPPAPTPKPTQRETVKLASGERRSVQIEATNDKEWNDLAALAEGGAALSLDQKDITHRTIAAIAAVRVAHEADWKPYCESRGMKWRKEAKSPFQCPVMWALNRMTKATGEKHTSKASMVAGCLDEYWEIARPKGMKPDDIVAWLGKSGGYTTVYRDRLERLREPKDKIAERYGRYLSLPPLEQRAIPEWLSGFDGEIVVSAHLDRAAGKLEYRSVWQPEGSSFWYSRVDQFIAARPDYGAAVEPIRAPKAMPTADRGDAETKAGPGAAPKNDGTTVPSAEAAIHGMEVVADDEADSPHPGAAPETEAAAMEPSDETDDKPRDPGIRATLDSIQSNLDASMADLAAKRRREDETEKDDPAIPVERAAPASGEA